MTGAGILALVRRFWWTVPIVALTIALLATRSTLADRTATLKAERDAWSAEIARAEAQRGEIERRYAQQGAAAAITYADRIASREPIIIRSTDTVRTYAQTDAGRARCLGADRVRGIDALDAALFPDRADGASAGDEEVPAEPD